MELIGSILEIIICTTIIIGVIIFLLGLVESYKDEKEKNKKE